MEKFDRGFKIRQKMAPKVSVTKGKTLGSLDSTLSLPLCHTINDFLSFD